MPTRTGVFVANMDATSAYMTEARMAWVSRARCRSTDPDEFFVHGRAQMKAAVICQHCPVVAECLACALDNQVEFGVWGGMTERQRRVLLKQHPEVVSWSEFFAVRRNHRNTD
jgi:WhiB family transcriptional regulator, redox-sensing transcriptional regulator